MLVYDINNSSLQNFPNMKVCLKNEEIYKRLHGGALISISSEKIYGKFISHDLVTFETKHRNFTVLEK
jgi:hypothetical protein